MVSFSKNHNITSFYFLDMYLLCTFLISGLLWFGGFFLNHTPVINTFFSSLFLVTNYYYFSHGLGWSKLTFEHIEWPLLLLVQIFSLMGLAHMEGNVGVVYLCIIPASFGLFFFSSKKRWPTSRFKKGAALVLIMFSTYLVIYGITKQSVFGLMDAFYFALFFMWGASILYLGQNPYYEQKQSLFEIMTGTMSGIDDGNEDHSVISKDRLFFHDLINQTHGVDLYLNQKIFKNQAIGKEELESLRDEIRLIQSLIRDHYGFFHKNLFGGNDLVTYAYLRRMIHRIIDNFLPGELIYKSISFQGIFEKATNEYICLFHYPTFCRILTNLVKNINEVNTNHVEFFFDADDAQMRILVKNKVCYLKDDEENMVKNLKNIILETSQGMNVNKEGGLGLESIGGLVEQYAGSFQFELQGEYWVNRITLPLIGKGLSERSIIKPAA